jgi:predicted dehydrogenase
VLGTGQVARKFTLGLRASPNSRVSAVGSRSHESARVFVDELGLACPTFDYQGAVGADVDAVYVATPPATHLRLALLSVSAGRATLVEKPFTVTGAEARELAEAAHRQGVFCMEAMWTRFLPLPRAVDGLLREGVIGELHTVVGGFGTADAMSAPHLLDPTLGGGALLDRAVYPLSFVIRALGLPSGVAGDLTEGRTGVDEEAAAVLRYDNGALAVVHASLRSHLANDLRYVGTEGSIVVQSPAYRPVSALIARAEPRGRPAGTGQPLLERSLAHGVRQAVSALTPRSLSNGNRPLWRPYRGNGYQYQAEEVAACVAAGRTESTIMPLADSIAVLDVVDQIRSAAHVEMPHPPEAP